MMRDASNHLEIWKSSHHSLEKINKMQNNLNLVNLNQQTRANLNWHKLANRQTLANQQTSTQGKPGKPANQHASTPGTQTTWQNQKKSVLTERILSGFDDAVVIVFSRT